jgi:hypothetical protein
VTYSVPPDVLGSKVSCRVEVDSDVLEILWGGTLVARHILDPDATEPVWDPAHLQAAEAIALGRDRPLLMSLDARTISEQSSADELMERHDLRRLVRRNASKRYYGSGPLDPLRGRETRIQLKR